jgi:hypothetical protein
VLGKSGAAGIRHHVRSGARTGLDGAAAVEIQHCTGSPLWRSESSTSTSPQLWAELQRHGVAEQPLILDRGHGVRHLQLVGEGHFLLAVERIARDPVSARVYQREAVEHADVPHLGEADRKQAGVRSGHAVVQVPIHCSMQRS